MCRARCSRRAPSRARRRPPPTRRTTARAGGGSSLLPEDVADAADRVQEPRLALGFELAAQVADVDLERVRARAEVIAPDALEDLPAGEHLAGVAEEELEHEELRAGELDRAAVAGHGVAGGVQLEAGVAQ